MASQIAAITIFVSVFILALFTLNYVDVRKSKQEWSIEKIVLFIVLAGLLGYGIKLELQ
jgi:hypothetical protein